MEPRPIHQLQSSLSEASGFQRRQEGYHVSIPPPLDARQNLPGLRDIFTDGAPASTHARYQPWEQPASQRFSQQPADAYYRQTGLHPPLALHHPSTPLPSGSTFPSRRLELPILETSPVARQPSYSVPVSPYAVQTEARDYVDARPEHQPQPSAGCYMTNGASSPYAVGVNEDSHYRSSESSVNRIPNPNFPLSAESQKKYMGVRDVPGEGAFHFYEGGYRIPTQVDGEQVNPAWGLTKANKPRKRLALACLDCREKKIKCEPGANSCLQCEKAKRPCRR